jgi:hypothetical protein
MEASVSLKRCFKCGNSKPRTEFYPHSKMADGLLGKCKECSKRDTREWYWSDVETSRKRDRVRKRRSSVRSGTTTEAREKWAMLNQEKVAAQTALGNAVRDGRVKKWPCFVCGEEKSQGHHEDYSRPFDVMWMCAAHHSMWHLMKREAERVLGSPGSKG